MSALRRIGRIHVLVCLAMVAGLVLLLAGPVSAARAAPKAWTVMVYIDGDNNLEDYVVKDIETELSALGSNASVNVVCIADRGPGYDKSRGDWQTTKLFYCTQGMLADAASAVADWGERNMGDKQTLIDFVGWAKTNYPATNYLLAFWDHGYMWFPNYWNIARRDERRRQPAGRRAEGGHAGRRRRRRRGLGLLPATAARDGR